MRLGHCSDAAFSAGEQFEWPQISMWCDCTDCVDCLLQPLYFSLPNLYFKKWGVIMDITQFRGVLE